MIAKWLHQVHARRATRRRVRPAGLAPALLVVAVLLEGLGVSLGSALPADGVPAALATAVAAGWTHSCALTSSGAVKCWGANNVGQLGDGTTTDRWTPVDVSGLASGVVAIAAGGNHTCALTSTGGVKCWGGNGFGGIGDGTTTDRWTPVDVSGLTRGVVAIAVGAFHTCAVTSGGGVECWGINEFGGLGDGTTTDRWSPVSVSGLSSGVVAVAAGGRHTCAVTSGGGAKCWGHNQWGQVGDNTGLDQLVPVDVMGLTAGVTAITAGGRHTCARTAGGRLKCWGRNDFGQVGDGTTADRFAPVDVSSLANGAAVVSAGRWHTCAVSSAGSVLCWGSPDGLGDVGDPKITVPQVVTGLTGGAVSLASGEGHTCVVMVNGGVKCFGNNVSGELGDGTTTGTLTPVDVQGFAMSTVARAVGDYTGDGRTDIAVYRPSSGAWFVQGQNPVTWGVSTDVPVPADYDGDGKTDVAVYRPSSGAWFIRNSASGTIGVVTWGVSTDVPVPGDYDGDGKADIAVYRPSSGAWFIQGQNPVAWGVSTDVPVPADYDGDGKTDVAVYRPSSGAWFIRNSASGTIGVVTWGVSTDIPVPGDYDGDGRADIAVYRPSTGEWFILRSTTGSSQVVRWGGLPGDKPEPGDYDGDGRTDVALWRPSNGIWYVNGSTGVNTTAGWGVSTDTALPLP